MTAVLQQIFHKWIKFAEALDSTYILRFVYDTTNHLNFIQMSSSS